MASLEYIVPLCAFERRLLESFENAIPSNDVQLSGKGNSQPPDVFDDWAWSGFIRGALPDIFGERLVEDYHGNQQSAYDGFLIEVSTQNHSSLRVDLFREANVGFLDRLAGRHINELRVIPDPGDTKAWILLSRMCHFGGRRWARPTALGVESGFDVYQLVRSFILQNEWPKNHELIFDILCNNPLFNSLYDVQIMGGNSVEDVRNGTGSVSTGEKSVRVDVTKRKASRLGKLPRHEPAISQNEQYTPKLLDYILKLAGDNLPLQTDLRSCLLAIPWNQLTEVDQTSLELPDILTDENIGIVKSVEKWLLWDSSHSWNPWISHLYTEEEVYSSCVLKDHKLPNFLHKDKILFALSPIESTNFFHTYDDYWANWNDCAITREGTEGKLYLLETVPGLLFRFRQKREGRSAALAYFRNIAEAQATNESSNREALQSLLGKDYSSIFEYSLLIIPHEQFMHVDWATPIGRGDNGEVYKAKWRRPPSFVMSKEKEDLDLEVVLKKVQSRGRSEDSLKKLMKELNITHAALSGSGSGCVTFLGITTFTSHHHNGAESIELRPLEPTASDEGHSIYLVFECATQGTLLPFLAERIRDLSFYRGWQNIIDALVCLARGLRSLHDRGVIHRDLHLNNALVTDQFFPHEPPPFHHQFQCLISDVGESKMLNDLRQTDERAAARTSYGATDFRAPEIHQNMGWTMMADVFAFGVIICKMLSCRRVECQSPPPDWVIHALDLPRADSKAPDELSKMAVPTALKEITEKCLMYNPQKRPAMREVVEALDPLLTDIGSDLDHQNPDNGDPHIAGSDREDPETEILDEGGAGGESWASEAESDESRTVEWTSWDWGRCLARSRIPEGRAAEDDGDEEPPADD